MEIFMRNIPWDYDRYNVKDALAVHLHGPVFFNSQANFDVHLHKPRQGDPTQTGTFTVTDLTIARRFLYTCGSKYPIRQIWFGGNPIEFSKGRLKPRPELLDTLSRSPWVDPANERKRQHKEQALQDESVSLQSIQFGWMCRDDVFSIESEARQPAYLRFNPKRREIHVSVRQAYNDTHEYIIAIRQGSILGLSCHTSPLDGNSVIFLQLEIPPAFFRKSVYNEKEPLHRLSTFPLVNNPPAIPYTSLALRLLLSAPENADIFTSLCKVADLRNLKSFCVDVERRQLFSHNQLQLVRNRIRTFDWCVAYQMEALLCNLSLDATELLELVPKIQGMVASHDKNYVAGLLRQFSPRAKEFLYSSSTAGTISHCFDAFAEEFAKQGDIATFFPTDPNLFQSLHVTISPTSMFLDGPFLDKSNRVIRRYDRAHQECFLRVEFRDENNLAYRFDKDVDCAGFVQERIGPILTDCLMIAGRKFKFLAYSQSALKEHSVWFVKMFRDSKHGIVTAAKIIESLGSFKDLWYDPQLTYCPARYGARISQAFTATDAAIVEVDEILIAEDVKSPDGTYDFTDGSGDMSEDIARDIWRAVGRKKGRMEDFPHVYQIRFQGSKGMLSIDYKLTGSKTISLRPSMIKFDAPGSIEVEIVEAFDKPTSYYLNRPLIMVLEDLGVPYEVFHAYQEQAVKKTNEATRTLGTAARLLQTHGLGASFRLASTMANLAKSGIETLPNNQFYEQILRVAVYHVLRDLKYYARIPIPNAWTLVGVADTHHYLEEGQVFACIKRPGEKVIYLEGPVLISRSPTIHPGDIQMATAIGIPPPGSCFAREPLPNSVVFSVRGQRPLSTCLAGGDLDGDLYNIIPLKDLPEFMPDGLYPPAEYLPAQKKLTATPCTMNDVAQFVMEYIISDVIGVVATNWLIIADQSEQGINDPDCLTLAQLHSDAVDYPKTGRAVEHSQIPRARFPKPDWSAPETVDSSPNSTQFYQSQTAIGRLSREINLEAHDPSLPVKSRYRLAKRAAPGQIDALTQEFSSLGLRDTGLASIFNAIEPRVDNLLGTNHSGDQASDGTLTSLFGWFSAELTGIASTCSLSHRLFRPLSEEEIIIGTIIQKTSQRRLRKDRMAKLREMTERVVRRTREVLEGDEAMSAKEYLKRAWMAWKISLAESSKNTFGAKTFGWVCLGAVFDALKLVEEEE